MALTSRVFWYRLTCAEVGCVADGSVLSGLTAMASVLTSSFFTSLYRRLSSFIVAVVCVHVGLDECHHAPALIQVAE